MRLRKNTWIWDIEAHQIGWQILNNFLPYGQCQTSEKKENLREMLKHYPELGTLPDRLSPICKCF